MPPHRPHDAPPAAAWLDPDERATWLALVALTSVLPSAVEAHLQRDCGMSFFEYTVLSMLSEQPDYTLQMSQLAAIANGSLSRLSHVARRLEDRNLLHRRPLPEDGRITIATLTPQGLAQVIATAPAHVQFVRANVFDPLLTNDLAALRSACMHLLETLDPTTAQAVARADTNQPTD